MKKIIPLVNLQLQNAALKPQIDKAIAKVIKNGQFILGEEVEKFEKAFARFTGTKYAVGVDSGLSALELGMRALGIGDGDEVITPVNSFIASSSAISFTGAKPVLVDCDEATFNIDVTKIEEKISKRTKAIMPVHLYGRPANMEAIMNLARKHKLMVIEDACQAHGAEFRVKGQRSGVKVGSIGIFGAFSFYPAKNLGAFGDGGMLVTDSLALAEKVRQMRSYGQTKKYHHKFLAYNRRLDTLQAAILLVKLKYLKEWNRQRVRISQKYNRLLAGLPLIIPHTLPQESPVFHQYVIVSKKRDRLAAYLKQNGIMTGIHYPIPIHLQEAYRSLGYHNGEFPVAESLAEGLLSLPIYPELSDLQIEYVAGKIRQFFKI